MNPKTRHLCTLAVVALGAAGAPALAGYTTINAPPGSEAGTRAILGQMYGGTFSAVSGSVDFTNGALTAKRLLDDAAAPPTSLTEITTARTGDSFWTGPGAVAVTIKAKYAGHNSTFGYFDDTVANPTFVSLLNTGSINQSVNVDLPDRFRWAIRNNTLGKTFTSNPADNTGSTSTRGNNPGVDQLVSYRLLGGPGAGNEFALMWEDLGVNDCSDRDFNDAAISISVNQIPSPGAGALAIAGLGMIGRRRRAR